MVGTHSAWPTTEVRSQHTVPLEHLAAFFAQSLMMQVCVMKASQYGASGSLQSLSD